MAKKAKVKKVYSRKASTGIAAAPVDTFHNFNEYLRCEVDKKEIIYTVKRYLKENLSKEESLKHIENMVKVASIIYAKLEFINKI